MAKSDGTIDDLQRSAENNQNINTERQYITPDRFLVGLEAFHAALDAVLRHQKNLRDETCDYCNTMGQHYANTIQWRVNNQITNTSNRSNNISPDSENPYIFVGRPLFSEMTQKPSPLVGATISPMPGSSEIVQGSSLNNILRFQTPEDVLKLLRSQTPKDFGSPIYYFEDRMENSVSNFN